MDPRHKCLVLAAMTALLFLGCQKRGPKVYIYPQVERVYLHSWNYLSAIYRTPDGRGLTHDEFVGKIILIDDVRDGDPVWLQVKVYGIMRNMGDIELHLHSLNELQPPAGQLENNVILEME